MTERWLRRDESLQYHRVTGAAQVSSCGMLHGPWNEVERLRGQVPAYFCRRCTDIKAKGAGR